MTGDSSRRSFMPVAAALEAVRRAGGGAMGDLISTDVPGVGCLEVVYARDPEGNIIVLQHWHPF